MDTIFLSNSGIATIDFDGTPVGTPSSYESFAEFYLDTTQQSVSGYLGSALVELSPPGVVHCFDEDYDGIADHFTRTWADATGTQNISGTTTWLDSNVFKSSGSALISGIPYSVNQYGRVAYDAQGDAVGLYFLAINPVFTLTPDTVAGDALIATFAIPSEPGTWSLLDSDLNGVVDHLTNASTYFDYNNVQQTDADEYAITWSDTTHFTANRIDRTIDFGTTFDSQGRPTTITYYTSGATEQDGDVRNDVPIVWQAKGSDNVVATFSFTSSTNTEAFSGKFFDTNGDAIPDQIIVIETDNGVTKTKTGRLYGWENLSSNHPVVSVEVLTSPDPSELFFGTITGTSSNPTSLEMASYFMGSNGVEVISDTTLPTLTSSTPADDAAHVLVGSDMTLTFSEAVQAGTGNIVISDGTDIRTIAVTDSSQVTISGDTVIINPTDDLHVGNNYHVEMADGVITDLAGNAYSGISDATTLNFATKANEAPVIGLSGTTPYPPTAFTEQTPVAVCNDIIINDPDGDANWNGGSLSVQVSGNASSSDSLSMAISNPSNGGIWLKTYNKTLMAGDTAIGTADAASVAGDAAWHFTFNENATDELVQQVARAITFNNSSDTPSVLDRTITFTVADHLGADASIEQTVTVTAVNDPATFSGSSFGRIIKDSGIYTAGGTLRVNDVDSDTTIHAQTDVVGAYGIFTIAADGVWSYAADTAKLDALGGTTLIVTDTFRVITADGTARNIVVTLMTPDAQGGILVNGLGGPSDFGENFIARNDDYYAPNIDITSVFGVTGLNFLGTNYTTISINNNGNITFGGSGLYSYTPWAMQSASAYPMIAAFFADVDTRAYTNEIDGPGAVTPTPGGNSTGSNLTWYDFDATGYGTLTVTWDDVGYYSSQTDKLNAFQMRLIGTGGGNFDVEFRYEDINWTTGSASGGSDGLGGTVVRAGYTAGNGTTYYELPQSGIQEQMLALDTTHGNTGLTGLYYFSLSNGSSITENQVIYGSDVNSILTGGTGNDTLYGSSGADMLNGGVGTDILYGGSGDDLFFVDDGSDTIVEEVNGGNDTVQTTVSYSLASLPNVENIRLVGSGNIYATGNDADNLFISNSGSNILDGGAGSDTVSFELSHSAVTASLVSNTASGDGADTLISIENLIGSINSDTLTGNAGNNVFRGLNGADTIIGLGGNDTIDGGAGDDTVVFSGNFANYTVSFDGSSYTITDSTADRDGTDTITGVEHFQFADGTRSDFLPPTLVSATPADAAMSVSVSSDITLTFSEAIQFGSGTIAIHAGSPDGTLIESYDVADSTHLSISGNTLTINPTDDLANNVHFFVTLSEGSIADVAGNTYGGTTEYDFTTETYPVVNHDLYGNITFWKGGAAISNVQPTLATTPMESASQQVEFHNLQHQSDGSYTVELWSSSTQTDINSFQFELLFPESSSVTWQASSVLSGWMSALGEAVAGRVVLGGASVQAMQTGEAKLGVLTFSTPETLDSFALSVASGWMGDAGIMPTSTLCTPTDEAGSYRFENIADGWYHVAGESNTSMLADAVTVEDALAALKMAVGLNPNTEGDVLPYQYLAADINHDGKVRANDALNILKMAVNHASAPADEWIYVRQDQQLDAMNRSHVDWSFAERAIDVYGDKELDLIGVVKGDVDGSWAAIG